jgi:hypothetical protein
VLESFENEIIEHEKSLLELKYKRDKLNEALKELKEERVALLGFVPQHLPEVEVPESKTYRVGDYYDDGIKQGVVFEVWDDGKHGKIVSLEQNECKWSVTYAETNALSRADGKYNMRKIRSLPNWQNDYPAFAWCASLGDGWYLPAHDELYAIYAQRTAINKALKAKGK